VVKAREEHLWHLRRRGPLAAAAALAVGLAFAGCGGEEGVSARAPAGPIPEQHIFGYHLVESRDAVRQWILDSDEMLKFAGNEEVLLVTVDMEFFEDGEYFSTLTADSGRANLTTNNVFVWGDVVVLTEDGRRLETEQLYYDNVAERIHNDVFNRITDGADVSTGIGLVATPDLSYIEIKQEFVAEIGDESFAEDGQP